jgi:hypothetical protein
LGIEAQREAIARFAADENMELAGEYVEIETGKGARSTVVPSSTFGESWPRNDGLLHISVGL